MEMLNRKLFNFINVKKNTIRIISVVFIALFFASSLSAQYNSLRRTEFGIRYMPTISSIDLKTYNNDIIKGSVSINHGFGIMVSFNLTKHFGIQGEVNYYQVSQTLRDLDLSNEVNIKYLNVPVLLSINTNKEKRLNFNLVAGPQFGINAGAKIKSTGTVNPENVRAVVALKKGDVGIAYGAGFEFAVNNSHTVRLDFGYRGFYGMVDINASKTADNTYNLVAKASRKTNVIYAGVAFLF